MSTLGFDKTLAAWGALLKRFRDEQRGENPIPGMLLIAECRWVEPRTTRAVLESRRAVAYKMRDLLKADMVHVDAKAKTALFAWNDHEGCQNLQHKIATWASASFQRPLESTTFVQVRVWQIPDATWLPCLVAMHAVDALEKLPGKIKGRSLRELWATSTEHGLLLRGDTGWEPTPALYDMENPKEYLLSGAPARWRGRIRERLFAQNIL